MVSVWLSSAGLNYHSFINPDETIKAKKYFKEINEMHQKLTSEQPTLVNRKCLVVLYNNARPHVSMTTHHKQHTLKYKALDHSPHSPCFSPTDLRFFKHLGNFL